MPLECRKAKPYDFLALEQMLELYQYELSDIWHQDLDAQGRYGYDLTRHKVGQMPANAAAQGFWRSIIAELTAGEFTEVQVTEGWWQGVVQRIHTRVAAA